MLRGPAERPGARAAAALVAVFLAMSNVNAQSQVTLSAGNGVISGAPAVEKTIALGPSLPPVLRACLFAGPHGSQQADNSASIDHKAFAANCVVPYINGLWLDPKALLRTHDSIAEQARDELIAHPAGEPFPIFYPPQLGGPVLARLKDPLSRAADVTVRPLPAELPAPTLSKDSLYNNIGLLFLPNAYVVPGGTFNEMYGWDTFFIVKGMLASVDYIMEHPTARIWSPSREAFIELDTKPGSDTYYRAYANRLFQVAKGMVDNHIFQIAYYGGFILNANRTYYLNRSQPPLFTQAALAVYGSALRYGFSYQETLAPYLEITRENFKTPATWRDWLAAEVLPAARTYYAYWTDPETTKLGARANPRVVPVTHEGKWHHVYLYGTNGVGPAPEVARSTQPQNRLLYADVAKDFAENPDRNPDQKFYNPTKVCTGNVLAGGCGDPVYKLTEAFYHADRAVRASGYDLSGRFGKFGEWTMNYAPISLNVLLVQMAADMDRIATIVGQRQPFGSAMLAERRAFLKSFFTHPSGGYADRFVGQPPAGVPQFTYPYGTQFYLLWAGVLEGTETTRSFIDAVGPFLGGGKGNGKAGAKGDSQFGIPTSLMTTGMQWDMPYAWAPIQYFAADGLAANGYYAEAARVMLNWIAAVNLFFAHTGIIIEKYDSVDPAADPRVRIGYSHAQHGFGWSNAAYMLFVNRLYSRM